MAIGGAALLLGLLALFVVFRIVGSSSSGGTSPVAASPSATPLGLSVAIAEATATPVGDPPVAEAPDPTAEPDTAPAPEAAPAPEVVVGLVPQNPGRLRISSSPAGAAINLNNAPAGQAPMVLTLPPGEYTLTLATPTYESWTRQINLTAGQDVPVDANLVPLPALKALEIGPSRIGRDAYLDAGGTIRIGTPADAFTVADEVNAIVYLKPSSYKIRDLSFKATTRWQRPGEPQPLVLQGEQQVSRDWEETFVRACAPAAAIDPRGSNVPLRLEILIDDEVVAQFTYRIGPGNPAQASGRPCDTGTLPSRVASRMIISG
jgi:hypothetical protein